MMIMGTVTNDGFVYLGRISRVPESAPRPRLTAGGITNTPKYKAYKEALFWELKVLGWKELDFAQKFISLHVEFGFVLPKRIGKSELERGCVAGGYCDCTKDVDNLLKGIMDSMFSQDKGVVSVSGIKLWSETGKPYIDIYYQVIERGQLCVKKNAGLV